MPETLQIIYSEMTCYLAILEIGQKVSVLMRTSFVDILLLLYYSSSLCKLNILCYSDFTIKWRAIRYQKGFVGNNSRHAGKTIWTRTDFSGQLHVCTGRTEICSWPLEYSWKVWESFAGMDFCAPNDWETISFWSSSHRRSSKPHLRLTLQWNRKILHVLLTIVSKLKHKQYFKYKHIIKQIP